MNKKIIYLIFIGFFGLFLSCEKDETKVALSSSPVVPTFTAFPSLTLQRANGSDTIVFKGSAINPGFQASVNYYLEADTAGNQFQNPIVLVTDIQDLEFKFSVGDLNTLLLKKFPADKVSSADFRIRAVLTADAGTGVAPLTYNSDTQTADITIYGLPRLDLISGSSVIGKVESALGNGKYTGYVKLEKNQPFTLKDPDANIVYGDNSGALQVDGGDITATDDNGWHKLSVNTNDLTYELKLFKIGLIGDATPNGWSAPDQKMDYNSQSGAWVITLDLTVGSVKFRVNDDWGSGINLGIGDTDHPEYTKSNLWNNGSSQNIPISEAGNYTVKLFIGSSTYSCTFTKNN